MNKVKGKVITKESGVGIANLLIVIYDLDPDSQPVEIFCTNNPVLDQNFWSKMQADRLGSVLTNEQGEFELAFEDTEFQVRNTEKRPDLVLFVMAPEETVSEKQPISVHPSQQILHYSYVPRTNAGRTETYIIRLATKQLDQFDIVYSGRNHDNDEALGRIKSIDRARKLEEAVRKRIAPHVQKTVNRKRELKGKAKELTKELAAVPLLLRKNPFFVKSGQNPDEIIKAARDEGLKHLKLYKTHMLISLTDEELERYGIEFKSPGEVSDICTILSDKIGGSELTTIRSLLEGYREAAGIEAQLEDATREEDEEVEANGEADDDSAEEFPSAEEQIQQRLLGLINDLPVVTNGSSPSIHKSLAELKKSIREINEYGGPADVPAFHDFYTLQLAFKNVWVEAFDVRLQEDIETLLKEFFVLHEEFGLSMPPMDAIREVQDVRNLINELNDVLDSTVIEEVPQMVARLWPELDQVTWNSLSPGQKDDFENLAWWAFDGTMTKEDAIAAGRKKLEDEIQGRALRLSRVERSILRLGDLLSEPYAFHYFAPNSTNFGLMSTYRQQWVPETYQVGDLVSTIPLAPGESRKFTTKQVIKKTRAEKEAEKSLSSIREEAQLSSRAESEIMRKAVTTTNFSLSAQGNFNIGIGTIGSTSQFSLNQVQESREVKKAFREAVVKSAQEYKKERALEVETTTSSEFESTTSGEITNPNNEKTVTYLLYELERRYSISEHLHRLTPVILVAQDVPAPHEIDEAWLLAHEWVLRRVMLDDSFQSALDYLTDGFGSDELSLNVKKANWKTQTRILEKLEATVSNLLSTRDEYREMFISSEESRALAAAIEDNQGFLIDLGQELGGFDSEERDEAALKAQVEAIKKQLEFLDETLGEKQKQLSSAKEALDRATREYTAALEGQTNRRLAIDQLRIHVKQNILYYMQAIWDHEPPDQRFFRLYHLDIEILEPAEACRIRPATIEDRMREEKLLYKPDGSVYVVDCSPPDSPTSKITRQLVEIADLDRPLGYKGNYIIFPLKECTHLTNFMMQEYIDDYFGIRDPDEVADFPTAELLKYIEQIWHRDDVADAQRENLRKIVRARLTNPRRESDTIIVQTGQIYVEALMGNHTLLEEFKQLHRGMDVEKVRAEVRQAELENLRRAWRLIEGERGDPDIEKKIVFQSSNDEIIVPPEA